jgi:putative ABC transport system permease protein
MNLWAYSLREMRRRPGRTLLTLLGIALGIATLVATSLTTHSVHRAYRELFKGLIGPRALAVAAPAGAGFDAALGHDLAEIPGVHAVVPCIESTVALLGPCGPVSVVVLGIDERVAGQDFSPPNEGDLLLDAELAHTHALVVGNSVRIWTVVGQSEFRLAGLLPRGTAAVNGGAVAVVSLADAGRLCGLAGQVNSLRVRLTDGADPHAVRKALSRRLSSPLSVQPAEARSELAQATLLSGERGLAGLSAVALAAAGLLTVNTFLLNLGERRRHIATLRTLGATIAQVRRLLLREAFLLGLAGAVLGGGGGLVLAVVLTRAVAILMGVSLPSPQPGAASFLLAAVLGPGLACAAAWYPIRTACRRPVLDDLLNRPGTRAAQGSRFGSLGGFVLFGAGVVAAVILLRDDLPHPLALWLTAPVAVMLLVGFVLVLPHVLSAFLGVLAIPLRCVLGVEGVLAHRQLSRDSARTGLTIGVLLVVVVMAVGFGHALFDRLRDVRHWYHRTISADFLVRGAMPDLAFLLATSLPEALADDLARLDGVLAVDKLSFLPVRVDGRQALLLARTFSEEVPLPLDVSDRDKDALSKKIQEGGVVLDTRFADALGVHPGDRISLETADGPASLPVAGTVTEYTGGGRAFYLSWEAARRMFHPSGAHVFLVSARAGAASTVAAGLKEFCDRRGLLLQSNAELRGMIESQLSRVVGVLWVLMILAFVVAALGIVNTLAMNVRQQARDFAVLRSLGMTRGQLSRVVRGQALLAGVAGLLPGTAAGLGLAFFLNRTGRVLLGQQSAFRPNVVLIACACALALVVARLATFFPGRRAARVSASHALRCR